MSNQISTYNNLETLVAHLRTTLSPPNGSAGKDCVLIYAYNGTGKTRLSGAFKNAGKNGDQRDTLYFNSFTEDLFSWDNDLETDTHRVLLLNKNSRFFSGIQEQDMENKIRPLLGRYADFNFLINYKYKRKNAQGQEEGPEFWTVNFIREEIVNNTAQNVEYIKISRGEENLFIWCFFLAVAQLAIDKQEGYDWVKYIYIDDPISSLDDNNTIALANHLAQVLKNENNAIKTIISTHHILFFNVLCNDLKRLKHKQYFLHRKAPADYTLRETSDTPFYHHVASLSELKHAMESDKIKTYHFNSLRSILEKTSSFFGYNDFGKCIHGIEDQLLFERALNLFSHGKYSVYEPVDMIDDNKDLFKRILNAFLEKYEFYLPELLLDETQQAAQS
jgi:wobble nucleotide-excising tRNase